MQTLKELKEKVLGLFEADGWIKWMLSSGFILPNNIENSGHCQVCTKLHECWFLRARMPKQPLHQNCKCRSESITAPIAGVTAFAECPIDKFENYIFSDKYAWNGKRDLFNRLGFGIMDSEKLKNEFERQAQEKYSTGEYKLGKLDNQGQRIDIEIAMDRNNKTPAIFISGWMVRPKGKITNNTPLGDR